MRPRLFSLILAICCSFAGVSTCFAQSPHIVSPVSAEHFGTTSVPSIGNNVAQPLDKSTQADELVAGLLLLLILVCVAWYAAVVSKKTTKKAARRKAALEAYVKKPWLLTRTRKNTKLQQYAHAQRLQEELSTFLTTRSYGVGRDAVSSNTHISYASKPYKGEICALDNSDDFDNAYSVTCEKNTENDD